ncbi:hypothetical protein V7457_27305 [Bacillus toyonensis]
MQCAYCRKSYEYGEGTSNNGYDFCSYDCEQAYRYEQEKDKG